MQTDDTSSRSADLCPLAIAIAFVIAGGTVVYILHHEPLLALPHPKGVKVPSSEMEMRLAAANVMSEIVGYLASLTIALAAVAAFLVKDGFGSRSLQKSINIVLAAVVAYYLIKSLLFAYDAYGMIAIQLSEGYFLLSRVQQVISAQAQKLLIALVLTAGLITSKMN